MCQYLVHASYKTNFCKLIVKSLLIYFLQNVYFCSCIFFIACLPCWVWTWITQYKSEVKKTSIEQCNRIRITAIRNSAVSVMTYCKQYRKWNCISRRQSSNSQITHIKSRVDNTYKKSRIDYSTVALLSFPYPFSKHIHSPNLGLNYIGLFSLFVVLETVITFNTSENGI